MNLRAIFILLSLLVLLYTSIGGYIHYRSVTEAAFQDAYRRTAASVEMVQSQIDSFMSQNRKPVLALAGFPQIIRALERQDEESIEAANGVLDHFQGSLDVDVCYIMNTEGVTVASSNRGAPDSFVGENFNFRPYFRAALEDDPAIYMALGTTSHKRGIYYSHPVYDESGLLGAAVIKASVDILENEFVRPQEGIVMLTDPHGVIFMANQEELLFKSLWRLTEQDVAELKKSRQFGMGPWKWSGFELGENGRVTDQKGGEYLIQQVAVAHFSGWRFISLRSVRDITRQAMAPVNKNTGLAVLALFLITAASVYFLYYKASKEIALRKSAERELRQSEKRYRSLYNQTPALLHSIDSEGRFLSFSEYWLDALGYEPEDVLGKKLADFLHPESRRHAENVVLPEFFRTGHCKNVPYLFRKKNGEYVDVLLSAIAEYDETGKLDRSLAVLVDISDRRRAEQELERAQEQLRLYSEDLERQVRERTREISRLSGSIMSNQEAERAAIARELHDELGQVLTALRMEAVWLRERFQSGDVMVASRIRAMCELIDSTISDVRGIATRLRPAVLDDLGLIDALEWFTTDFEQRTNIACIFTHRNVGRISGDKATAAYRITQEALTNVARHSTASNAEVDLEARDGILTLTVYDDGQGFDPHGETIRNSVGIAGMRERATLVGGTLAIWSEPGRGVEVKLTMPVRDLEKETI